MRSQTHLRYLEATRTAQSTARAFSQPSWRGQSSSEAPRNRSWVAGRRSTPVALQLPVKERATEFVVRLPELEMPESQASNAFRPAWTPVLRVERDLCCTHILAASGHHRE